MSDLCLPFSQFILHVRSDVQWRSRRFFTVTLCYNDNTHLFYSVLKIHRVINHPEFFLFSLTLRVTVSEIIKCTNLLYHP